MTKVALILSGCGVYDGSEIREAVLTHLALDEKGVEVHYFAPDIPQYHVINHLEGAQAEEVRGVLVESARIARGDIKPLIEAKAEDFDAVVLPGGFGAAKNLCTFALEGSDCHVNPEVAGFLREMHVSGKPIGLACIAPAIAARVFGEERVELTIGNDAETAKALEQMGARHVDKAVSECHLDAKQKIVTTPAYMYGDARVSEVFKGIQEMVRVVLDLTPSRVA